MWKSSRSRSVEFAVLSLFAAGVLAPSVAAAQETSSTRDALVAVTVHAPDAFYDPPSERPDKPGVLLRSEPLKNVTLPYGLRGWRILYTTTIDDNTPATAVATVFAPANAPAGPRPVIMWEHGTTGLLQKCMPSLVSAPTSGIPALDHVARAGWVVVATDYSFAERGGPHPYMIGEGEARAGLDSVRAARQMQDLNLDPHTVVWGHSQGGHAALWTGIVGPRYAPDVEIAGVAAIAPPGNMLDVLNMNLPLDKRLGPYLAMAYSRFYPDITFDDAILPEARTAAREMAGLCGFLPPEDPLRITALAGSFDGRALNIRINKALDARLAQNTAKDLIAAPLLIAQGLSDVVVLPEATKTYVDQRCAAGQQLDYWTFMGIDHGLIIQPGSPLEAPLVAWTIARFADDMQLPGCARTAF
ncbi:alpha/beta hydrolase [Bradyrhizobium sp. SYSU BS000235]|uniref:alpha/beta hydrolase family protein n=1 Tax=Bradyrhizobium sp. SYSU BS000235 TaxID=3411332 RepID=UPI003C78BB54